MKIVSWNVNGLRSVSKKGFLESVKKLNPDILCLQEIKLQEGQIPEELKHIPGFTPFFNFAKKPGYSGTAIYSKVSPETVNRSLGLKHFDQEGRFLELKFSNFTLLNLYIPHGRRGKELLAYKLGVYGELIANLKKKKSKDVVVIGDFNIAHTDLDLTRPKSNRNNIMFTPEERAQIDELIKLGFVDTFREFNKEGGNYSWWPYFRNARGRNLGWRIDYCFVSSSLKPKLKSSFIEPHIFGSDHCPVGIELV